MVDFWLDLLTDGTILMFDPSLDLLDMTSDVEIGLVSHGMVCVVAETDTSYPIVILTSPHLSSSLGIESFCKSKSP